MWRPSRGPSAGRRPGAGERLGDTVPVGLADREIGLTVGAELVALVKDTEVIRLDSGLLKPGKRRSLARVSTLMMTRSLPGPVNGLPDLAPVPTTMRKSSPNRVRSSRSQLPTSPAGGAIKTRRRRRWRASRECKPRHDRLASPRFIPQEKPEARLREHVVVNRDPLVGQRVDHRDFCCKRGVKEVAVAGAHLRLPSGQSRDQSRNRDPGARSAPPSLRGLTDGSDSGSASVAIMGSCMRRRPGAMRAEGQNHFVDLAAQPL